MAPSKRNMATRLLEKALMPIVATVVSAAAGYAAKKAQELIAPSESPKGTVVPNDLDQRVNERAQHRAARRATST